MSFKVIELNDSAVRVSDESGILLSSPGFALVGERGLEVGDAAERQARIKPTSSFNKFWHQLSMEPLNYSVANVRHFADLAYAHLLHISQKAEIDGDVILAVPGNFTKEQLAILLGLSKQCPFNPVGIVDAALASAMQLAKHPTLIYADIQLHQVLLTRFSMRDGKLQRDNVTQIPQVGWQNFMDLVMQLATGLFIQQCRFNPQHNANSEQQLYNELPRWLSEAREARSSLLMEIKTENALYQAKLPWESLVQKLADFYLKINQQIRLLAGTENCQILVSSALAQLPDYYLSLGTFSAAQIVTPDSLSKTCIDLRHHIDSAEAGIHLVTRLPVLIRDANISREVNPGARHGQGQGTEADQTPTHVLFNSRALPLGKVAINNDKTASQESINGQRINLTVNNMPDFLGQIEQENGQVFIVCGEAGAIINGQRVTGKRALALGDSIKFSGSGNSLSLIKVQHVIT